MARSISSLYTCNLHKNLFPYYANWLPDEKLALGDYGVFQGKTFVKIGNIEGGDLKIRISRNVETDTRTEYKYTSARGTKVQLVGKTKLEPGCVQIGSAALQIDFKRGNSIYFHAVAREMCSVTNLLEIGKKVLALYERGKWRYNWVVVTCLVKTGPTTVVTSTSNTASITLQATADVPEIDLGSASLKLTVKSQDDIGLNMSTKTGLTPLFRVAKVHRKVFSAKEFSLDGNEQELTPAKLRKQILLSNGNVSDHFMFDVM